MPNQPAVLGIANKQKAKNIVTREIGAHIEFTRISGRRDDLCVSEKPQFIPANLPERTRGLFLLFEFD